MSTVSDYSELVANALLGLIDSAGGNLANINLPPDLNLVTTFEVTSLTTGAPRGFLATGKVDGIDGATAVLALSATWPTFVTFFRQSQLSTLTTTPTSLKMPAAAKIAQGYAVMYSFVQPRIWDALKTLDSVPGFADSFTLLVAGMGPAGPIAQLAALDVRPGQPVPDSAVGEKSKVSAVGGYAFSTPAYGNADYANAVVSTVPSAFLCNLDGVDLYPAKDGAHAGLVASGTPQALSARVPNTDDPWYERTPAFYQTAFGAAQPALPTDGRYLSATPGFNPDLAYTLSTLSMIAYARFQHPDLAHAMPGGYTLAANIEVGSALWGNVFTTLGQTVVALRGPCSWIELLAMVGEGTTMPFPPAPQAAQGRILKGLSDFYPAFATALAAGLAKVPDVATNKLIFTGHDFGGALAALAGVVQKTTPQGGIAATSAVYGFGTARFCDYPFQGQYQKALSGISFHVTRPNDVIARNAGLTLLAPPPAQVELSGGIGAAINSTTGHALAIYNALMNPVALARFQTGRNATSSASAERPQPWPDSPRIGDSHD